MGTLDGKFWRVFLTLVSLIRFWLSIAVVHHLFIAEVSASQSRS